MESERVFKKLIRELKPLEHGQHSKNIEEKNYSMKGEHFKNMINIYSYVLFWIVISIYGNLKVWD